MALVTTIANMLPAVEGPDRDLGFRDKLTWTGIILILYFLMGSIVIYGASSGQIQQLQQLQTILGSQIGTLITLGIGPIVSASIILQLLVGADILPWDTNTSKGRQRFQSTQKVLAYLFCIFEAIAFVGMGAIRPAAGAGPVLIAFVMFQVAIGGIFIIIMDEIIKKWGFGSGVSLFILAGVSQRILIQIASPFTAGQELWFQVGGDPVGLIMLIFSGASLDQLVPSLVGFGFTIIVFLVAVYAQAMRVEIPLTFGNVRGFGQKWPLKFVYTNVIPVIFVGALLSNLQLILTMLANQGVSLSILNFAIVDPASYGGQSAPAANTLLYYFTAPTNFPQNVWNTLTTFTMQVPLTQIVQIITYSTFYIVGSAIFSIFWMRTSGQDPASVADQIANIGMKVPGHRKDTRVIEKILNRYIPPLAVLGGAFVGMLAAVANFTNAFGSGTGILLAVMIAFQLYEELAKQHMEEMHPTFRKFMEHGAP